MAVEHLTPKWSSQALSPGRVYSTTSQPGPRSVQFPTVRIKKWEFEENTGSFPHICGLTPTHQSQLFWATVIMVEVRGSEHASIQAAFVQIQYYSITLRISGGVKQKSSGSVAPFGQSKAMLICIFAMNTAHYGRP